jgi:hypothetical protein
VLPEHKYLKLRLELRKSEVFFKGISLTNMMEVSPFWEDHLSFYKLLISKPSLHRNAV